jgi:hypothetical protein
VLIEKSAHKAQVPPRSKINIISHLLCVRTPREMAKALPTTTIAGVEVVWTPIIQDALEYARANADDMTHRHIICSWLFGVLEIANNPNLTSTDLEVQALGAILHDLGWAETANSPHVSPDKRFEVDGAIGARKFIRAHRDGKDWEERRVLLLWDSIALHGTPSIGFFKEQEVQAVGLGIVQDVGGKGPHIPAITYDKVVAEYPQSDVDIGLQNKIIWLCRTKPESTYGSYFEDERDVRCLILTLC